MFRFFLALFLCICLGFTSLAFAVGGGGGGGAGGGSGSSVPFLHIIGQSIFVIVIAVWFRHKK
jgi:hypothetical protein